MEASLYERLGSTEGITQIASDVVDNHMGNPRVAPRYANTDVVAIKKTVAEFFITGTGGPEVYKGMDMVAAHAGMNIDAAEFVAVLDDALAALSKNNVGQHEQEELLFTLYSMKGDIVFG
jgi:hemoglobin